MRIYDSKPVNTSKQLLMKFFWGKNSVSKTILEKQCEELLIVILLNEGYIYLDKSCPDNPQYRITEAGKQHRDE